MTDVLLYSELESVGRQAKRTKKEGTKESIESDSTWKLLVSTC